MTHLIYNEIINSVYTHFILVYFIFNAYIEETTDMIIKKTNLGVKLNRQKIDMLQFADDK